VALSMTMLTSLRGRNLNHLQRKLIN
jgi:hypothetical protein